jgi:hypothetical protein
MTMTSMPMVHEHVHQGTGQQKEIWQRTNDVCQMLGQKKIAGNCPEDDQTDRKTGTPKTRWSVVP